MENTVVKISTETPLIPNVIKINDQIFHIKK